MINDVIKDVQHRMHGAIEALHREIAKKAADLKREGKLEKLHEELAFDQRLAAIQQDSKENGEAIIRHLRHADVRFARIGSFGDLRLGQHAE